MDMNTDTYKDPDPNEEVSRKMRDRVVRHAKHEKPRSKSRDDEASHKTRKLKAETWVLSQ